MVGAKEGSEKKRGTVGANGQKCLDTTTRTQGPNPTIYTSVVLCRSNCRVGQLGIWVQAEFNLPCEAQIPIAGHATAQLERAVKDALILSR